MKRLFIATRVELNEPFQAGSNQWDYSNHEPTKSEQP